MERERFEELVEKALEGLPPEFAERLDSIAVVVQDWPTSDQLQRVQVRRRQDLLGLYQGLPLTERDGGLAAKLPDKISIFQKPIEMRSHSEDQTIQLVRDVVYHEIAHYFGISDQRLEEIEAEKDNKKG